MGACYLTPKARIAASLAGIPTAVAFEPITAGETVAAFGGTCAPRSEFERLSPDRRHHSIQIDDDLFMVTGAEPDDGLHINHACAPNCGMSGAVLVVAMRDIAAGESLTHDLAMTFGDDVRFACRCGRAACRTTITGDDWMLPELQVRYRGHFSPYLARRIAALVSIGAERRAFAL